MLRSRRQNRLPAFGMVDAIVGILILTAVASSVAAAFSTLAQLDHLEDTRINKLVKESDAAAHVDWY